jgi:uncharacterized spore protein YtfJ
MFKESVETLASSLERLISSKTVIGEPITVGDVTIIPIIKAGFGFGSGAGEGSQPIRSKGGEQTGSGTGGGAGGGVAPVAMIVIQDGKVEVYSLGQKGMIEKLVDMAPEIMSRMPKYEGCC